MLELPKQAPGARRKEVARDAAEQRGDPGLVVHERAGRAAPDRIDPREVVRRPVQGLVDLPEVPCRIRLPARIPGALFAELDHAVDDRGDLAVAGAQVEPDAAAIQVAAQVEGRGRLGRKVRVRRRQDLERRAVDRGAHHRGVKHADRVRPEVTGKGGRQPGRAVDVDSATAPRPQQRRQVAFDEPRARRRLGSLLEDPGLVVARRPAGLLDREPNGAPEPRLPYLPGELGGRQCRRPEPRIEGRRHPWGDKVPFLDPSEGRRLRVPRIRPRPLDGHVVRHQARSFAGRRTSVPRA